MARATSKDAQALFQSLLAAYTATPTNLKIIDLYVVFTVSTALIQVAYIVIWHWLAHFLSIPSYLVYFLVLAMPFLLCLYAVCLRIQVNQENKEFKDLPPERAFADFVLCNLVLHLVIMNFLG